MAIPASDLIARAGDVLQDVDHIRWTVPELLRWFNDAAREVIIYRPSAHAETLVIPLRAGTYQEIPIGGVQLLDVTRNMGAAGSTPGVAVRHTDRQLLSDQDPYWNSARPAKSGVLHYSMDDRNPKGFYVWPQASEGWHVEALITTLPAELVDESGSLDMGAEYINALVSYTAFRAFSKDDEYANGTVAAAHYQAFATSMGATIQAATAQSANKGSA